MNQKQEIKYKTKRAGGEGEPINLITFRGGKGRGK